MGQEVTVDFDDGTSQDGTLVELRPSGPRVRFADRERTVAAWRIVSRRQS